ncbi:sensor domain-containing diguanylate cyclase [Mangrovibacillus cuniculi]|uniref:Diguanylate cyclase n=1 Tax=Mangrovibacillus cuniculi TaxID=2593652 RepID=A0A7S8CCT4_9BACI|nr:diguanylate cyclase [Mangrovibacillus cuniculi]QPC47620.1 diguanylate cyclase [Mangrovibacillus cuniculi]
MKIFKGSLRTLLAIIFAIVVCIVIVIVSMFIGQRSIDEIESEIGHSLEDAAYVMGENLDQYMWSRYGEVSILSELQELKQQDYQNASDLLNKLQERFPSFSWVGLTNQDGTVIASTNGILTGHDISTRPVFTEALDEVFIGDVHEAVLLAELLPNPTGETLRFVDISTPVYDDEDNFIGVLAAHLSWEWAQEVENFMRDTLQNREGIEFFIVSKADDSILLGPKDMVGEKLDVDSVQLSRESNKGWTIETWSDGKQYLTGYVLTDGYSDYPGLEWTVLVRQPVDVAYAPAKELVRYIFIVGSMLVLFFAIAGWFIAGRITDPLKRITTVADNLRDGATVTIPKYEGIREIEILSTSLRDLVTNLTTTEVQLEEMEHVAHRDFLTGLANRNGFDHFLEQAIDTYDHLTILYLDLDGFKAVNDKFGHDAGDKLLIEVGARLDQFVQKDDLVSRIGGDEFVVTLSSSSNSIEHGNMVGEQLISLLNKPFVIDDVMVSIGCSVGGATWSKGDNISDVIRLADQALYSVKRSGKNRMLMHEEST